MNGALRDVCALNECDCVFKRANRWKERGRESVYSLGEPYDDAFRRKEGGKQWSRWAKSRELQARRQGRQPVQMTGVSTIKCF